MNLKNIRIILFFIILSGTIHSFAGDLSKPYAVSNIPKNLFINANAVIRNDQMTQTIENIYHSKVKIKHATTLLNEKASKYRYYRIPYNKFVKISSIKANVYDSNGELLNTIRPNIRDISGNYGDLANDTRYWFISYPLRKYPFTIEIEYEKTNTGSFIYDDWSFQSQPDVAVEQSGTQLLIKKGIGFRVHEKNLKHRCDTFTLEDKIIYTWQEENIPAIKKEELFMVSFDRKIPYILTAPNEFKMGGINGSMESWESLGRFYYDLNKDRDNISAEFRTKLLQMISITSDRKEIIKILFQYLQKNTRYVSIQLGIGGFQTLEASFVEKRGYGDCKALSNYMKAILKGVGITSYQAWISSGEDDIITSFPSNQFNHAILCVPLAKDTIWLECTNQTVPFNFLGSSNSNKHALLLTEKGGKLVKTPNYRSINNKITSNFMVNIDMVGGANVNGKQRYEGVAYEIPHSILNSNKQDREDFINSLFSSPNITIKNINYSEETLNNPSLTMECDVTVRDFVSKTKKRMIFNPYLFDPAPYLAKLPDQEFKVNSTMLVTDTITYSFPFGYRPEFIPEPVNLESKFGKFNYQCQLINDKLVVRRLFEYYEKEYDKNEMDAFIEFVNNMAASERQLVILLKE